MLAACSWAPPSSDHKRRGLLSAAQLGHPDARERIQRECKSSRSVRLLTLCSQAASGPYSSRCHEALPALRAHLTAAKGGGARGPCHRLSYNTLRLADETLFFIFVIILITHSLSPLTAHQSWDNCLAVAWAYFLYQPNPPSLFTRC